MNRLKLLDFSSGRKEELESNAISPRLTLDLGDKSSNRKWSMRKSNEALTESNLSIIKEVRVIQTSFLAMKRGLRSFSRYVPREIVEHILSFDGEARLGVHHANMTVFFSDIENYTTMAESMSPSGLIEFLGQYFTILTEAISSRGGMVAEFLGDGVMAFWNAPLPIEDHASVAIDAALACQKGLDDLQVKWQKKKLLNCYMKTRIGLNSGEVLVGNIGSPTRLKFGIVGDNVNLASRIEGLNKMFGTQLLVSEETRNMAASHYLFRPLMRVMVKGRRTPTLLYEVVGRLKDAPEVLHTRANLFAKAFEFYNKREFGRCIEILSDKHFSHDKPAKILIEKSQMYLINPPPSGWDGVEQLETK
eukprot:TRINITY_DN4345_c0_g2_i17.p1 TRINITY_DN4345_c0_g2~~TRINITY_DN4345_c0_g2_i17.p1  ORF type:complete len:362 (+),score=64.44 TRINITY_DN4345_c0_g2_i17:558-1643(+)